MGLLDGGLQKVFGAAFSPIYLKGSLHRATKTFDTGGDATVSYQSFACRVQVDSVTEAMRGEAGYTEKDVALLILQSSVTVKPNADDEVTAKGLRWRVGSVSEDPASTYWQIRGTPK